MTQHVHIVCDEAPWPADHSKAIDTMEQIRLLHEAGVLIHLHYFCSDTHTHPTELNRYCASIHQYCNKDIDESSAFHCSQRLVELVSNDKFPVIFEGIYCTGVLKNLSEQDRNIIVRMYDDECRNCDQTAKLSGDLFKKLKWQKKSGKIRAYEKTLPGNCTYLFTLTQNAVGFSEICCSGKIASLPLLHSFSKVISKTGLGQFCLYHGDLSDPCNDKAAQWLLKKVFNDIKVPLVIGGKHPGKTLSKLAHLYTHTCLVSNPSNIELDELITKAQINVVPSFSYKRPELKLIHALSSGRHCVTNEVAVEGTGLQDLCYTASSPKAFKSLVLELAQRPFEEEEIMLRKKILNKVTADAPVDLLLKHLFN